MELKLIKLSLERILQKMDILEQENTALKERIANIENKEKTDIVPIKEQEDILIDTKEVLQILGISYNTLRSIVRKNLIIPIRINQRRVRYSKKAIREYIKSRSFILT